MMNMPEKNFDEQVDSLLVRGKCFVIDPLPERVSAERGEQYARLEPYYHTEQLFDRFADLLLKLNSYYDYAVRLDDQWVESLSPREYCAWVSESCISQETLVFLCPDADSLIRLDGDDTHMTVFTEDDVFLERIRMLAGAEGLFLWEGVK